MRPIPKPTHIHKACSIREELQIIQIKRDGHYNVKHSPRIPQEHHHFLTQFPDTVMHRPPNIILHMGLNITVAVAAYVLHSQPYTNSQYHFLFVVGSTAYISICGPSIPHNRFFSYCCVRAEPLCAMYGSNVRSAVFLHTALSLFQTHLYQLAATVPRSTFQHNPPPTPPPPQKLSSGFHQSIRAKFPDVTFNKT